MIALRIIVQLAFHESRKNHLGNPLSQFIFGSVLQRFQKGEQAVVGPKAGWLSAIVRFELGQGCFFQGQMSVEVGLRRLD
jgi:hypothetical protein